MTDERTITMEARLIRLRAEQAAIRSFDADRTLAAGQLTPRQRVAALLDEESFLELGALARRLVFAASEVEAPAEGDAPADGIVAGYGLVDGRPIALVCEDAVGLALTDGKTGRRKRDRMIDQAVYQRIPLVYIADGASGERPAYVRDLREYHRPSYRDAAERGAPFVAIVLGSCREQEAALVATADLVITTVDAEASDIEASTGVTRVTADLTASDDAGAIECARCFLRLVPPLGSPIDPAESPGPVAALPDDVVAPLPAVVLDGLLDTSTMVPMRSAPGVVTGLGAIEGFPVAFAASGGEVPCMLGTDGVRAVARVAALARRFRLPLLVTQDCRGYDPADSTKPEFASALTDVLGAMRTSSAPKVSLITGAGYAVGEFVLGGVGAGFDLVWAWPSADVETEEVDPYNPVATGSAEGPWAAADLCLIDDVLAPSETRAWLSRLLRLYRRSRAIPPAKYDRGMTLTDLV